MLPLACLAFFLRRELLGDRLMIAPEEAGVNVDSHGVYFFHLPLSPPR